MRLVENLESMMDRGKWPGILRKIRMKLLVVVVKHFHEKKKFRD